MKTKTTTIKLNKQTKNRLDKFKAHPRETYDGVLQSMLNILSITRTNPERARARLRGLERQVRRTKAQSKA